MQSPTLLLLLLAALAAAPALAVTWDEERLQWLVVTRPGVGQVQLNCTSEYIYPFTLLNDSSVIGALGSLVRRAWWILPDARLANATYDDGNLAVIDNGTSLLVRDVKDSVYGLYHCAVEATTMVNDSYFDPNSTTVYYYKRGLNLYGPDLYGGSGWEKYKRNTLIGGLTAGIFLLTIAWYALMDRLGVFAKCGCRSNTVSSLQDNGGPAAAGATAAEAEAAAATEMKSAPTPPGTSPVGQSRESIRSRQSKAGAADGMETTIA